MCFHLFRTLSNAREFASFPSWLRQPSAYAKEEQRALPFGVKNKKDRWLQKKRVKQKIPARDEDAQSFERFLSLLPRENQPDVLLKLFVSLKKKRKSCPRDHQAVTHSTTPPGDSRRLVRSSRIVKVDMSILSTAS